MIKKTATNAKVVKKTPAKLSLIKVSAEKAGLNKILAKKMPAKFSVAKAAVQVVTTKPIAKAVQKKSVGHDVPKAGVRMLTKVQTAEGWKQAQINKNGKKSRVI